MISALAEITTRLDLTAGSSTVLAIHLRQQAPR
jgi:hypothetical protein